MQLLRDFYIEVNIDEKVVEVIYVSSDKAEADFKDTYAKMPWLTYRWDGSESSMHRKLNTRFDIKGVPLLYVLEANTGFMISKKGRKDICDLGVGCLKNWAEELP